MALLCISVLVVVFSASILCKLVHVEVAFLAFQLGKLAMKGFNFVTLKRSRPAPHTKCSNFSLICSHLVF